MGNAGKNGGEYYTPRPLIKSIIRVVNPQIGETVYDAAVGTAGFLSEAYTFMRGQGELSSAHYEQLQKYTFVGKEKKSLAYVIGIMNMILHGVEAPNIVHTNTLSENITDILQNDVKNSSANNENDVKEEKVSNLENDKLTQGDSSVDSKEKVSKTKNIEKAIKPSKVLKSANVKSKDEFEEKETAKDKKNSKESME